MIEVAVDETRGTQVVDAIERFAMRFTDLFVADRLLGEVTEDEVRRRTIELLTLGSVEAGLDMGTFSVLALGIFDWLSEP